MISITLILMCIVIIYYHGVNSQIECQNDRGKFNSL